MTVAAEAQVVLGDALADRRVLHRLERMPHGLDVVAMEVVDERRIVPLRVLRPDPGLPPGGGSVGESRFEERIDAPAIGGVERDVRRPGHRSALIDGEVIEFIDPVVDAVLLDVELLVSDWCECGRVQAPARGEVAHDEQHVVDDDPPSGHEGPFGSSGTAPTVNTSREPLAIA
jgi:hypothetical protein